MTEYLIGPGQEYETFASLPTLIGNDVVSGLYSEFFEKWILGQSGSSGDLITVKNAILNGDDTIDNCFYSSSKSYFDLIDLYVKDATTRNINIILGTNASVKNITSDGADYGLYASSVTDFTIESATVKNAGSYACYCKCLGGDNGLVINRLYVDETCDGGLWLISSTGMIHISNVYITLGAQSSRYGMRLDEITAYTGSVIENFSISGGTSTGAIIGDTTGLSFKTSKISNVNDSAGWGITGLSNGLLFEKCEAHYCDNDGFSVLPAGDDNPYDITFSKCTATNNGSLQNVGTGDGYTAHETAYGLLYKFCYSENNLNTAYGLGGAASGKIYHHTSVEDGINDDIFTTRACLYIRATGAWEIYNSIFMNTKGYRMGLYSYTPNIVADYNCYISTIAPTGACFASEGDVDRTWAEWVAVAGEANSIYVHIDGNNYDVYNSAGTKTITLDYCPVAASGIPVDREDNPLFYMGITETQGVNDGNKRDIRNKRIYGPILPGCYQSIGMQSCNSSVLSMSGLLR